MLKIKILAGILIVLLADCCASHLRSESSSGGQIAKGRTLKYSDTRPSNFTQNRTLGVNSERLAVVVLLTDLDRRERDRIALLRTSLKLCAKNLFPSTPTSLYIFTFESLVDYIRKSLSDQLYPNVEVLPLDNSTWKAPSMAGPRASWHSNHNLQYRLMGDWRLSYMPAFAKSQGHRYVLQLDDDSFILSPVGHNLVELFDRRGYLLAARDVQKDPPLVTWGLPELARYYLVTHKVVPATLFEFCDPPNIEGLYSRYFRRKLEGELPEGDLRSLDALGLPGRGGWNRTILFGNCLMFSLDWWFRPEVNRFVQLCRATGGAFTYRWNEQGVIAMLWQMFVPRERFYTFEFEYRHRASVEELEQLHVLRAGANGTGSGGAS